MTERITTSFGPETTAAEVVAGVDLSGRRAVITGASSGIGVATARALAAAGAQVTLAVRDVAAGQAVAERLGADAVVAALDLSNLSSVAAFVDAWDGPLHILVNNAGMMSLPYTRTPAGWEMHFATNHLGHFALASGLRSALATAGGARVVALSSSEHHSAPVDFEDVESDRVAPHALDLAAADRLWDLSVRAVG